MRAVHRWLDKYDWPGGKEAVWLDKFSTMFLQLSDLRANNNVIRVLAQVIGLTRSNT